MNFEKIKELIKLVDASSLAFFELQNEEGHIKMDKSLVRGLTDNNLSSNTTNNGASQGFSSVNSNLQESDNVISKEETNESINVQNDENVQIITSPMVGTFYSKASPESAPFVEKGATVSKGKIICIIEAMKLMNEIESEYNGIIVECLAKDGDMVEYGQPLFKIKGE